jgi:hypothetical protein
MSIREVSSLGQHPTLPAGGEELAPSSIRANGPPEPPKPRLLDRVRQALRARHLGRRTEEAYVAWIRRLIFFHDKRHPAEMGAAEVTKFLTSLAVDGQVAASTQNQALSALLFLYKDVLEVDLPWLDGIVRARRPERLPGVLSRDEVRALFQRLDGVSRLMATLLYGAGLGSWNVAGFASRTSTSPRTRSWSGAAKATRTGSPCSPVSPSPGSWSTSRTSGSSTDMTSPRGQGGSNCRPP